MTEFKEKKKEVLIELIDILDDSDSQDFLFNVDILSEAMEMISRNVYRTFTNKSKFSFLSLN